MLDRNACLRQQRHGGFHFWGVLQLYSNGVASSIPDRTATSEKQHEFEVHGAHPEFSSNAQRRVGISGAGLAHRLPLVQDALAVVRCPCQSGVDQLWSSSMAGAGCTPGRAATG